jgi:5-formyltetrahydrofolate cyclo-ligase
MEGSKLNIRERIKKQITKLDAQRLELLIAQLADNLLSFLKTNGSREVAIYWPMPLEIDIKPIIITLSRQGYKLSLPCTNKVLSSLTFRRYNLGDELITPPHWPNLKEPSSAKPQIIPGVIITPLLAFDAELNRLGQGKGFYDYTFAQYNKKGLNICKLGLALEMQKVEKLPTCDHDIRLDAIITEKLIRLGS